MSWINRQIHNKNAQARKIYPLVRWVILLFLAAFVFFLTYTYYRAEIIYQGSMADYYFKYYLFSTVGILFWVGVLRLREETQANIVTLATSLVFGLYMIEAGLTLVGLGQPPITFSDAARAAASKEGKEYDERTKLTVIEDLIAEGLDVVPSVYPSRMIDFIDIKEGDLVPLAGISNKITVYANESGKYLIRRSDRHGFNNPDNQWDVKPIKWLLTGDSFVHGASVQPNEEMAAQLRSIDFANAISLGMSGNGPLIEYATLIEYGEELKAEVVLWVYYEGNDLTKDLRIEQENPLFLQYMKDGFTQNLVSRQKEIDDMLEEYVELAKREQKSLNPNGVFQWQMLGLLHETRWLRLYAVRNIMGIDLDNDIEINNEVDWRLFSKILSKAKTRVEEWGGALYFVYLPEYSRYTKENVQHDSFKNKAEVVSRVTGLGIPVVDIHQEVFINKPDPLVLFPFRLPGHYNAKGYNEIARAIILNINDRHGEKESSLNL